MVFFAAVALLCSCSPKSQIRGKWAELGDEKNTIEFFSDGTLCFVVAETTCLGNYTFDGGSLMKCNITSVKADGKDVANPFVDQMRAVTVTVSQDILSLTTLQGKTTKFRRVP